jgi:peptidoglycan/LPS O-acetylase OafA/YrhL
MNPPAANTTEKLVRPVMPELDSLRGIAILMVLFFHGFNVPGAMGQLTGAARVFTVLTFAGWTGVNLFFVLSGFLITGILLDSKTRPDYYRRFYIRRALRILPAFYLLLFLLWLLPKTGLFEGRHVGWPFLCLSFFYLANVTTLFGIPAQYAALWSLAVEEHFYLLWPTALRSLSRRAVAWCAAGIFILCPILRGIDYKMGSVSSGGYTWLVADGLAIGALLGVLSRGRLAGRGAMRQFSLVCILASITLFAVGTPFGIWRGSLLFGALFRLTAFNLFFTGLLGATLPVGASRWKWIVQRPILQWLGEISYGLYLVHMLAFDFVNYWIIRFAPEAFAHLASRFGLMVLRFILSSAIAVFAAFLSRRYFEERFLKLKDRWTRSVPELQASAPATATPTEPIRQTA